MTSAQRLPHDGPQRSIVVPMSSKCEVCAHFDAKGVYPRGIKWHDRTRHISGGGASECLCVECGRVFGGDAAFLAHLLHDAEGESICRDPDVLKTRDGEPRFKRVQRKHGMVWVTVVNKRSEPSQGLPEATTDDYATGDHPSPDRVSVHRDSPPRKGAA